MKIPILFSALVLSAFLVKAQEVEIQRPQIQAKPDQKGAELLAQPRPAPEGILTQELDFGGFFVDFFTTDNFLQEWDLPDRTDFGEMSENLSFYPNSERVQGVALFSIKF